MFYLELTWWLLSLLGVLYTMYLVWKVAYGVYERHEDQKKHAKIVIILFLISILMCIFSTINMCRHSIWFLYHLILPIVFYKVGVPIQFDVMRNRNQTFNMINKF